LNHITIKTKNLKKHDNFYLFILPLMIEKLSKTDYNGK